MRKAFTFIMLLLVFLLSLSFAEEKEEKTKFTFGGVYNAWFQGQRAFKFNDDNYQDYYVVQMLRLNFGFAPNEYLKAVARFDLGQGWWGVDNALRSVQRTATKGGSALFDFKGTNFLLHVDQAYISADIPETPLTFRIGRTWWGVGNKIMMDNNYDGIQMDLNNVIGKRLSLTWAKVSEGVDGLSDLESVDPDQRGYTDARDADLFTLNFNNAAGPFSYDAYGFYYKDRSIADNNAYIPDHLQFFKTRFSPQVTELIAVGLAATYKSGKVTIDGEFDYLTGKDDIPNTIHNPMQMWDINNGDLSGYNIFLRGNVAATDKLRVGAIFGLGSGDKDPTRDKGNVNKLRTSGFFYITEVWEDSIMPDEEGITPQGLGAPNVRGYRELENTTAFQVNTTIYPTKPLELFLSYTYLTATQPIFAWSTIKNEDNVVVDSQIDLNTSSKSIGNEIDFRITYKIVKNFVVGLRGGYFIAGDGAKYLINGNKTFDDAAWELKGVAQVSF